MIKLQVDKHVWVKVKCLRLRSINWRCIQCSSSNNVLPDPFSGSGFNSSFEANAVCTILSLFRSRPWSCLSALPGAEPKNCFCVFRLSSCFVPKACGVNSLSSEQISLKEFELWGWPWAVGSANCFWQSAAVLLRRSLFPTEIKWGWNFVGYFVTGFRHGDWFGEFGFCSQRRCCWGTFFRRK